jgi:riboflavin kinase/FMN adenylyltransferase
MNLHNGLEGLRELPAGSVLTVGNFDGVHRGHLAIIERARELKFRESMNDRFPAARIAVVTFEPHPLTVLRPEKAPPRLTTPQQKQSLLAAVGVDDLVVLPPTRQILDLTAEEFWPILRDQVRPSHLVEGESFNFGKDRGGTIDRLREWTAGSATALHVVTGVEVVLPDMQIVEVNSSLIRWLLLHGRVRDAQVCMARPYTIEGTVVEGARRGRTIGVPTANLACADQLIPGDGVYASRCMIGQDVYAAALSIGTLPTFNGKSRQVEAHLIGFDGDLYGRNIALDLIAWLRDQRKFSGIDALRERIQRDLRIVQDVAGVKTP